MRLGAVGAAAAWRASASAAASSSRPLLDVVARQGERVLARAAAAGAARAAPAPAKMSSSSRWSKANSPPSDSAATSAAISRRDRDRGVLVLQVDRQLELLRDVVRIELERALGLAQRAVEVAEVDSVKLRL